MQGRSLLLLKLPEGALVACTPGRRCCRVSAGGVVMAVTSTALRTLPFSLSDLWRLRFQTRSGSIVIYQGTSSCEAEGGLQRCCSHDQT